MSYIINNSRGNLVAVVADGTVNTTATDLALVGRALSNYGTYENENYVYLLENFAKPTAPLQPILGQLWYNNSTDTLSVYNSANSWSALATQSYVDAQKVSPAFSGVPTAPTAPTGTANTQIATTAFVSQTISNFSGTINNAQLIGNSTAITAALGTATTQIATTAFVLNQLGSATSIVATGNITGGNILTSGMVSAGGNIYGNNLIAANNISLGGTMYANAIVANNIVNSGTNAFRLPSLNQTQINGLSPVNGDMVYNSTENLPQIYQQGSWKNFTLSYYS